MKKKRQTYGDLKKMLLKDLETSVNGTSLTEQLMNEMLNKVYGTDAGHYPDITGFSKGINEKVSSSSKSLLNSLENLI